MNYKVMFYIFSVTTIFLSYMLMGATDTIKDQGILYKDQQFSIAQERLEYLRSRKWLVTAFNNCYNGTIYDSQYKRQMEGYASYMWGLDTLGAPNYIHSFDEWVTNYWPVEN